MSYTQRYISGDHEGVWSDLRLLGPVPDSLLEDCADVAARTMRRVAAHVGRLAEQLADLGLGAGGLLWTPPTSTSRAELDGLAQEIGTIPVALDACLRFVGGAYFAGDCSALNLFHKSGHQSLSAGVLPDPLVLPDVDSLRFCWDEYREEAEEDPELSGEGFVFEFAPDELHKANISGATHDVWMSERVADPVIHGIDQRPGITLVEYLRLSISWGGMPGWSFHPDRAPAALSELRVRPDF
ncbi:hypothetical protein ACWD5V_05755 [Streptomyces sp. NPDC002523]